MKNILVLMATYNGEQYIEEQIDSILNQTGVNVFLLIADDCSTDGTVHILDDYKKNNSNIDYYINASNLGYKLNFFTLVHNAPTGYDYYALADQDDVWLADKLISAVNFIDGHVNGGDDPILYSSNLMAVDTDLNELGFMFSEKCMAKFNPYSLLLTNKCTGCTAVFNEKFKVCFEKFPKEKVIAPHDTVMERIALLYGKYIFDTQSHILYRQHGNNAIGVEKKHNFKKYFRLISGKDKSYNSQDIKDILDAYSDNECKYYDFVKRLAVYKKNLKSKLHILFSGQYRKMCCKETLIFKIAILLNKY